MSSLRGFSLALAPRWHCCPPVRLLLLCSLAPVSCSCVRKLPGAAGVGCAPCGVHAGGARARPRVVAAARRGLFARGPGRWRRRLWLVRGRRQRAVQTSRRGDAQRAASVERALTVRASHAEHDSVLRAALLRYVQRKLFAADEQSQAAGAPHARALESAARRAVQLSVFASVAGAAQAQRLRNAYCACRGCCCRSRHGRPQVQRLRLAARLTRAMFVCSHKDGQHLELGLPHAAHRQRSAARRGCCGSAVRGQSGRHADAGASPAQPARSTCLRSRARLRY